ncbi:MAG: acyl-CoA dehydrogenase family protein, partial [Thermomicrobiales bacterium]
SVILALARNEQGRLVAAIVDRHLPGVSVGELLHPAGARTSPVAEITLDHVVLPADHILQLNQDGSNVLKRVLTAEKILGAFPAIGLMDGALATSIAFVRTRTSGGRRLTQLQYVQYRLTEMQMTLEMIRGFAHSTLQRFVAGEDVTLEAAALKHQAMKLGVETGLHAIKLCGSYGLLEESRLTMATLDGLAGTIGGGTEEAQRLIIYAEMIRRSKTDRQHI